MFNGYKVVRLLCVDNCKAFEMVPKDQLDLAIPMPFAKARHIGKTLSYIPGWPVGQVDSFFDFSLPPHFRATSARSPDFYIELARKASSKSGIR